MKKLWLFLAMLSGAFNTYAQNTNSAALSPAETFVERKGTILQKRFDEVGKTDQLNIQLVYISDLSNNDKMVGLQFDIQIPNTPSETSALLDSNQANGLISFLKYITAHVIKNSPTDPNTEISITDKYNLQIGCYWQKNSGWILYIRPDANNPAIESDIPQANIAVLFKMLTLAVSEMGKG